MTDIPDNPSTTTTIAVGGTITDLLETVGDHDWIAITLTAGQSITIAMDGVTSTPVYDTYLQMRDSAGNVLSYDDDGGPGYYSLLNFTAPSAGTYYIDAGAYFYNDPATDAANIGSYQLTVSAYTPPPPPPTFDYDQIADQLINGYWNSVGGVWRHFAVAPGGTITVNLTALTADGQFFARNALALWSDSLGITFQETTAVAQITFDDSDSGAYSTSSTYGNIIDSSFVNVETTWIAGDIGNLNSYSLQTYSHEIGHALGLGHAGNYNGNADYQTDALYANDAWSTTVMSYFSQTDNSYFSGQGFTYDFAVTPMVGDLVAMAFLYGTPTTTRTGNTVYGFNSNAGRDVFNASMFPNLAYTIIDSGGTDTLDYSGFANSQRINLNSETFSNVGAGIGNVSIARGTVIENAIGGTGNDTLIGNAAANVLTGGAGDDSLDGGAGSDTASYAGASGAVTVSLAITAAQATGGAGSDTLVSIENLIGSSSGDTLTGNGGGNFLRGGNGNDILDGAAGDDRLEGGAGDDRLTGGAGIDSADYSAAASAVVVDLNLTGAQNTRAAGIDTLDGIEQVFGSAGGDRLTGNGLDNRLTGNAGNDTLVGNAGNDLLEGGEGNDSLDGGAGNDRIIGGNGIDYLHYGTAAGGVTIDLSLTTAQNTGGSGIDEVSGIERVYGSRYGDTFTGDNGGNLFRGEGGDDTLNGAGGNDMLVGGTGNDQLNGGDGADRLYDRSGNDIFSGGAGSDALYYSDAVAGVNVNLGVTTAQNTGGAGTDTISGIEMLVGSRYGDRLTGAAAAERLIGGGGDDVLNGGAGNDIVQGDAGNDLIGGGAGNDSVYGGLGQDLFRFDSALSSSTNVDTLRDFSVADDTFQLSQSVFSAIGIGTLAASAFHIGSSAVDASDRIIYDNANGTIYYDADGSGAGAQVLFARVARGLLLTNADFAVTGSSEQPLQAAATDLSQPAKHMFGETVHGDYLFS